MDKLDLEQLPYPMFKTNWYEKLILRKALRVKDIEFLCVRINTYVCPLLPDSLLYKVHSACNGLLTGHLYNKGIKWPSELPERGRVELRNIWIKKLLEYKGE